MKRHVRMVSACLSLLALTGALAHRGKAQESSFNQGQARPAEDPAVVARGKTLYGVSCQACHGSDLRGGDIGGPNLLRSSVAMTDRHGENIVPIIQGGRQAQGMPKIGISMEDSAAVAAYVRSVISTIGGQGMPPGKTAELDIVVGDARRGEVYFGAHCAGCHSAQDDLRGVGSRYSARRLQAAWLGGIPLAGAAATTNMRPSATVTLESGETVSGTLVHLDDFVVTLLRADGTRQSMRRVGEKPAVTVHDPGHAHRDMLPRYTDAEIHDVTAYLVTLR